MSIDQGWAIRRNGSCEAGYEIDCGETVAPYHGCCPSGFQCPHQYNLACCPPGQNCTSTIVQTPRCSNSTWDLFDNQGYFCCEHGLPGYDIDDTSGCANPGYQAQGGEVVLPTIRSGETISSSTSSSATSATASPTDPPHSAGSSVPVGAIAGAVVGGLIVLIALIVLACCIMRRRQKIQNPSPNSFPSQVPEKAVYQDEYLHETCDEGTPLALSELPADHGVTELPTQQR